MIGKKLQIAGLSFRSIRNLTPKPNHLSFGVCDSVGPSNLQWRGWSHAAAAASVPSEAPDSRKGQKRVSKHERRAMVESFVNKHRSENGGKFPSITDVKKQVGGHFYTIRDIVQELEYKSQMKSSNKTDAILVEKLVDKSEHETTESVNVSSGYVEVSKGKRFQDDSPPSENYSKTQGHESEIVDMENHKKLEEKGIDVEGYERREQPALENLSGETSHSSPQVSNDMNTGEAVSTCRSDAIGQGHLLKDEIEQVSAPFVETSGSSHSKGHSYESVGTENHLTIEKRSDEKEGYERKEKEVIEDLPDVDSQKHKMEQSHGSLESDESKMGSSDNREPSDFLVSEKKSTLWGNLKSFADGFINIWRKL